MAEKRKQTPRPGVDPGDEVYFRHADGPAYGTVVCHGKHGCTIDHDGKRRRVYWSDVLGHRRRGNVEFKIVDRGDDGAIVTDGTGRHRFVAGNLPEPDTRPDEGPDDYDAVRRAVEEATASVSRPMTKALPAGEPIYLFFTVR